MTILIGGVSSTTNFNMTLTSKESRCIYEFFADNTLVIIILESDSKEISVSLLDPNQASLYNEFLTDQYIKLAFTTYDGGYFAICLTSNSKQTANLKFNIKHGIAAKDYSEVSKLRHLKPIELEVIPLMSSSKS